MVPRTVVLLLVLLTLAPSLVRRWPSAPPRPCEPEGRGVPPSGWIGCRGDPGPSRPLQGLELVLLGRAVDLDTATAEDLSAVPGIGPGLAAEVVRDREERGPFGGPDGLRRVRGIGRVRMERARPWLRSTSP